MRKLRIMLLLLLLLLWVQQPLAQGREVVTQQQQWYAFFSTISVSEKYSLHADFQYIPAGFALGRVGLIRQFENNLQVTVGFASSILPVPGSGSDKFNRHEHRPWAHVVFLSPLGQNFILSHRLRYELRILQQVTAGELQQKYTLTNRLRLQESVRLNFPMLSFQEIVPYVLVYDELFLNIENKHTFHTFDQNRLALMIGGQYRSTRLQVGYMNRYVKPNVVEDSYLNNHTIALWLFQNFDLRKREHEE